LRRVYKVVREVDGEFWSFSHESHNADKLKAMGVCIRYYPQALTVPKIENSCLYAFRDGMLVQAKRMCFGVKSVKIFEALAEISSIETGISLGYATPHDESDFVRHWDLLREGLGKYKKILQCWI
jgi:hypothetical protein